MLATDDSLLYKTCTLQSIQCTSMIGGTMIGAIHYILSLLVIKCCVIWLWWMACKSSGVLMMMTMLG